jgi:Flp pilus assembly protein TadG
LATVAAALFPMLALIGGGIDLGRGYLSQSRLQQACDAGVLAARKRLGATSVLEGQIPADAALTGKRFFNINFDDGAYGTENRSFQMMLEDDLAVSGSATVNVPTSLMAVFGFDELPVRVACQAQLSMANTDIMLVLDVTGSMAQTNAGDSVTRMEALKATVRDFHTQLTAAPATTRLRFGFVPYSTNVNVGPSFAG